TNLSANPQLETKIKRWIDGDRIALVASSDEPPPKRRRSLTQESTNAIRISFVYRLGTFDRLVLPGLSTEGLKELVFRAMRGKYNEFALFLNTTPIQANDVTIDKIGIKDQTTIQIRIPDHRTESPFHQKKRVDDGEMCLVK